MTTSASPAEGGYVSPSGTNWYDRRHRVPVRATAYGDYSFSGWSGDLSGLKNPASVRMTTPKSVVANFSLIREGVSVPTVPGDPGTGIRTIRGKPSIHFASPGPGKSLRIGTSRKISWVSENLNPSGVIHLSYWDIDKWREIAELPATATSYYWTIPDTPATLTFFRIGNWTGDTQECESTNEIGFAISPDEEPSIEGGWVFDISGEDEGGAAVWFEENKIEGHGISAKYGMFRIEGEYTRDTEGVISGDLILYGFDSLVELERGYLLGKSDSRFSGLTFVMQTTGREALSLFTMEGRRILGEQVLAKEWTVEVTGRRKGTFDRLEIESCEIDGKSYPQLYEVSGDGVIADAGPTEMNGYLFLTLKDGVYGIYVTGGGVSERGDFSGRLKSAEGKFSLKMVSDEGVRYDCSGRARH